LVCALLVLVGACAFPALAGAATYVVNTTVDTEVPPTAPSCGINGEECTLRDAINDANETGAPDTITFGGIEVGSQIQVEETTLTEITAPVTIEGDTAQNGTAGVPGVEIVPSATSGQLSYGLRIEAGSGTRIEDLAIGGFGVGIEVGLTEGTPAANTAICGDYLGAQINGELTNPNEVGVEVVGNPTEHPTATVIGGAPGCAGNLISGNSEWGVVDGGEGTTIGGDRIGVDLAGAAMPNGTAGQAESGGALLTLAALQPRVGVVGAEGAPDTIAFNHGPGVVEEGAESRAQIRHDSIYGNEGRGIVIEAEPPTAPTIAAATVGAGTITFKGTAEGTPAEFDDLDFFASDTCTPLGAGVGQTFLGEAAGVLAVNPTTSYEVTVPATLPAGARFLTVTSTPVAGFFTTTEFSSCFELSSGSGPGPEVPRTTPPSTTPPPITNAFVPVNGETIIVSPKEGTVLIKLPGTNKFVPLEELKEIPVGSVIDATKGKVTLTSIDPDGTEQTANFFLGVFRVKQKDGSGLVVLELLDTRTCPAPAAKPAPNLLGAPALATASGTKKPPASGKLWGSGHGNFRTEGNDGSATVRGTIWLVEDRCNGTTFFRTRRGIVSIRDFVKGKTFPLPAGNNYTAGKE
jgi:hypothetical protein